MSSDDDQDTEEEDSDDEGDNDGEKSGDDGRKAPSKLCCGNRNEHVDKSEDNDGNCKTDRDIAFADEMSRIALIPSQSPNSDVDQQVKGAFAAYSSTPSGDQRSSDESGMQFPNVENEISASFNNDDSKRHILLEGECKTTHEIKTQPEQGENVGEDPSGNPRVVGATECSDNGRRRGHSG
jgi:hypothetical protein